MHILLLEEGWLDGDGAAYVEEHVKRATTLADAIVAAGIPVPFIYPTVTNGYSFEWGFPGDGPGLQLDRTVETARLFAGDDGPEYFDQIDTAAIVARLTALRHSLSAGPTATSGST